MALIRNFWTFLFGYVDEEEIEDEESLERMLEDEAEEKRQREEEDELERMIQESNARWEDAEEEKLRRLAELEDDNWPEDDC